MNKVIELDVYHLKKSNIKTAIRKMFGTKNNIVVNFIDQSSFEATKNRRQEVILFEEDSFLNSIDQYEKIIKCYKKKPASIILSTNSDIYNVVRWMRKGASDYLLKESFNKTILVNSILSSVAFMNMGSTNTVNLKEKKYEPLQIPKNVNWDKLSNNKNYDLALIMFELVISEKYKSRYTKSTIEMICNQIKKEVDNIVRFFGGKLWYWINNFGVFVFHFGNRVDCAALAAITVYNNFFKICIEKLKLKEVIDFKIGINSGYGIFHNSNTETITSDLINSLSHLTKKHTKIFCLNITDNAYKDLNARLKKHFRYTDKFDGKKIYKYEYFDY